MANKTRILLDFLLSGGTVNMHFALNRLLKIVGIDVNSVPGLSQSERESSFR
jgi:hypothetical protein